MGKAGIDERFPEQSLFLSPPGQTSAGQADFPPAAQPSGAWAQASVADLRWIWAAQAAKRGIVILYSPLPRLEGLALHHWCTHLEEVLMPWLSPAQLSHLQCFGSSDAALKARCSRLLARALLIRLVMAATHASIITRGTADAAQSPRQHADMYSHMAWLSLKGLDIDYLGRPVMPGWRAAFSHSGHAAFCAAFHLGHEDKNQPCHQNTESLDSEALQEFRPCLAVDAESLVNPPPDPRAYSDKELAAPLAKESSTRDALRRWTIKEALLKSAGLGLSRDPALVSSGFSGQRRGRAQFCHEGSKGFALGPGSARQTIPCRHIGWQLVPCAEHWLCVAAPVLSDRPLLVTGRPLRAHWSGVLNSLG